MKISLLAPDLSHNCLGRAFILYRLLERDHEIKIVGPTFGDGIWPPLLNQGLSYETVKMSGNVISHHRLLKILKMIDGDVVYASKPFLASFGLGLIKKGLTSNLVLDIDDWELGFQKDYMGRITVPKRIAYCLYSILYPSRKYWDSLLFDILAKECARITVSSRFLQQRYGGTIIWHARDTDVLNPDKLNGESCRREFGINDYAKVVMFLGTPRPHKGVELLIEAVKRLDSKVSLAIIGLDESNYSRSVLELGSLKLGNRFIPFGVQQFFSLPRFLSWADIVVIPQRMSLSSVGQVPAKVFDAMAMSKPIVATRVSDIPEILDGCGVVVEPGSSEALKVAIDYLLDNPQEAEILGRRARDKCVREYSYEAMRRRLSNVFSDL